MSSGISYLSILITPNCWKLCETDPCVAKLPPFFWKIVLIFEAVLFLLSVCVSTITEILFDKGYILSYKFEDEVNYQGNIKIALKYNSKTPAIKKLIRVSKPGLRKYTNKETIPRVINGLGIAIISTSKGVITDKEARNLNIGGEVICYVY